MSYNNNDYRFISTITAAVAVEKDGTRTSDPPCFLYGSYAQMQALEELYPNVQKRSFALGATELEKLDLVAIPKGMYDKLRKEVKATSTLSKKRPLMCTYDAIKNYMSDLFGIRLSMEDEDFFVTHPLVQSDGVPMPNTLRVAQELIDPYGLRVSRVQLEPAAMVKGDLAQWRRVLGVNPIAQGDYTTSNEDYLKRVPKDESAYNFEFIARNLRPGVHCGGQAGGMTMGHATYCPPRRIMAPGMMSFQIERKERAVWHRLPVFAEVSAPVIEAPKEYALDLSNVPFIEKHIDKKWNSKWPKSEDKTEKKGKGVVAYTKAAEVEALICFGDCQCCGGDLVNKTYDVPGICDSCWSEWVHQVCECQKKGKKCRESAMLYQGRSFESSHGGTDRIFVQCSFCKEEYYLTHTHNGKQLKFQDIYLGLVAHRNLKDIGAEKGEYWEQVIARKAGLPVIQGAETVGMGTEVVPEPAAEPAALEPSPAEVVTAEMPVPEAAPAPHPTNGKPNQSMIDRYSEQLDEMFGW